MYGAPFQRLFPDETSMIDWRETWGAGLAGLTGEQMKRGLSKCLYESPKWAPSLGEFRALCEPPKVEVPRPEHQRYTPLPAPSGSPQAAQAAIAAINATLTKAGARDYSWTLRLRTPEAAAYVWRDDTAADLKAYMLAHGVVDEHGNLTPEQRARTAEAA